MRQNDDYYEQVNYISQAKTIDARIKSVVELLHLCNEEVASIKAVTYNVPKVQKSLCRGSLENQVIKMVERKTQLTEELEDLIRLKNELYAVVNSISNNEARTCLRMLYFENKPVHSYAVRFGLSDPTAYRRRDEAIRLIRIPRNEDR